jgi:hypothetical protein
MYPPCPPNASIPQRAAYLQNAQKLGRKITLFTDDVGEVTSIVWLSNFKSPGYSGLGLLTDLAFITAAEKLRIRRIQSSSGENNC